VIHWQDDHLTLYGGDCRAVLEELPAESVHCVVTSPPYWGLRDYGHGEQLGLEPTPEAYVENMVAVFREVRRVLRADGTLWLNLGDSYAAQRGGTTMPAETLAGGKGGFTDDGGRVNRDRHDGYSPTRNASAIGLKHKDLVGIPWRVAFALQADGWYLRSDIIWSKPNPMPESVTDRPTKAHEYLFLLTKSPRYYFDADAVREAGDEPDRVRRDRIGGANGHTVRHSEGGIMGQVATRNLRSPPNPTPAHTSPRSPGSSSSRASRRAPLSEASARSAARRGCGWWRSRAVRGPTVSRRVIRAGTAPTHFRPVMPSI
jgi:DNA modification methylase